ncbi:hypothetical protein ABW19_dt0209457 [Dactylella cylindrospora]|nr:hypothetical protein ABW19_dt0209457 [Dactylella cylindrospora]
MGMGLLPYLHPLLSSMALYGAMNGVERYTKLPALQTLNSKVITADESIKSFRVGRLSRSDGLMLLYALIYILSALFTHRQCRRFHEYVDYRFRTEGVDLSRAMSMEMSTILVQSQNPKAAEGSVRRRRPGAEVPESLWNLHHLDVSLDFHLLSSARY